MSDIPNSVPDLISRWNTIGDFASDIGCGYEAARQMRNRGRIAPEHWSNVIHAARDKRVPGITYEWLVAQRASHEVAS